MATLGSIRRMVASKLKSETTVTPFDLNQWINDGARDLARRTESLEASAAIAWTAGASSKPCPADLIRAHRCEFVDLSGLNTYLVELKAKQELDQVWGILHTQQSSYPSYGYIQFPPPNSILNLYPVPAQAGTINLEYYRLPAPMVVDTDPLDLVVGWEDILELYVESEVQRKERDPIWSATKQLYDEKVIDMIDHTRQWHDQAGVMTVGNRQVPSWLYDFDV